MSSLNPMQGPFQFYDSVILLPQRHVLGVAHACDCDRVKHTLPTPRFQNADEGGLI